MFLEICHEEFRFLLKLKLIKQQQKRKNQFREFEQSQTRDQCELSFVLNFRN